MAEEIVNISGVIGKQNISMAASVAANGLTMSGISACLDKHTEDMIALVTTVTEPTTKYFNDILSELKIITHATDTWNELILEGIMDSSKQLLTIASISANNTNYLKANEILSKLVVDNEGDLKNLKLKEILEPLKNLGGLHIDAHGENQKMNIDFEIKSNFDIRTLSDFLKTSQLYNPAAAFMFKRTIGTFAKGIAEMLGTIAPLMGKANVEKLNAAGEMMGKMSTLISTTQDVGSSIELFGKSVNFTKKESVWNKKNAKRFSDGVAVVTEAIVASVKAIQAAKITKANLNALAGILSFFEGIATLLQGEIQDSKGTRFSIGSLLKFDGKSLSKTMRAYNQKNAKKFQKTTIIVADTVFNFIQKLNSVPTIDQEKFKQIIEVFYNITNITDNMAKMKQPNKIMKSVVSMISSVVKKFDEIDISKKQLTKVQQITELVIGIGYLAELMEKFKKPKKANVAHTLIGTWLITYVVTHIDKITSKDKKNLDEVVKVTTTLSEINSILNSFKKPKSVAPTLISVVSIIWVLGSLKPDKIKSAKKNVSGVVEIALKLSEGMQKVDKDTYKSAKNVSKGINAITFSMTMLALMSPMVKIASKTLVSITSSISKASKSLAKKEVSRAAANMKSLAMGMAVLGLASVAFAMLSPVVLVACAGLKLLKFSVKSMGGRKTMASMMRFTAGLAMFGLAIWAFGEIVTGEGMLKTAGGIAMLAGAMWLFNGGGKWKGIKTGKGDPTKGMVKAAASLALLALATYAWQELVEWGGIVKVAAGIGLLAGASWAFSKIKGSIPKNMVEVAFGVAAMGGAAWVWQKAVGNDFESIVVLATGIGAMAVAAWAFSKVDPKKTTLAMLGVALGAAAFAGAAYVFSLANPSWELIGQMGALVGGGAIAGLLYQAVPPTVALSMGAVALGVAAMGGATWIWTMSGVTWETVGMMAAVIGGGALLAALYAIPIIPMGAAAMLVVGTSMVAIAGALAMAKTYNVTPEDADQFSQVVWNLACGYAKVALLAVPALIGSTLFTPVAAQTVIIAGSLAIMSVLPVPDEEKIESFNNSVWALCKGYALVSVLAIPALFGATLFTPVAVETVIIGGSLSILSLLPMPDDEKVEAFKFATWEICKGFAKIALLAIPAALGATLFLPVALGTVVAGGTLALMNAIKVPPTTKIETYMAGIKTIADGWDDLGIWALTKAAAKAVIFLPVAASTLAASGALRLMAALNIDEKQLFKNEEMLFKFVDVAVAKFNEIGKGKKAKAIKEGAEAVGKVAKVIYDIGQAVYKIASLEYVTHKINSKGELVPDKVLKLTDKDFEMVGVGVAKILNALTDPLIKIGEAQGNDVKIGNITVPGENKVKAGVEAISGIGGAILPLADLVKSIAESGILDKKNSEELIGKLAATIELIVDSVCKSATYVIQQTAHIEFADPEGLKSTLESIGSIYEPVSGVIQAISESGLLDEKQKDGTKWIRFSVIFKNIVDCLGDNAAKIVSFVKSKGGFWNSSDTNAEGIVQVLNSVGKIYEPLSGVLKAITDTGILENSNAGTATKLVAVVNGITQALTKTTTSILKFVEDNEDINYEAATKVMGQMGNIFNPMAKLIATIGATGILDPKNSGGATKLSKIVPIITNTLVDTIKKLASVKSLAGFDASSLIDGVAGMFKPISKLIATLSASGILDDSNTNGTEKIQTILISITDAVIYVIKKVSDIDKSGPAFSKAVGNVSNLFYQISKADPTGIHAIRTEIDAIYDKLSDDKPWVKFGKNLIGYEKVFLKIQRDINRIDLKRLILLKEVTDHIRQANLNGNIETLIAEIRNLVAELKVQDSYNPGLPGDINNPGIPGENGADLGAIPPINPGDTTLPPTPKTNSNQGAINRLAVAVENLSKKI